LIPSPPLTSSFPFSSFTATATTYIYTLSLHDALPIYSFLHSGELYDPNIEELMNEQQDYKMKLFEFNQSNPTEKNKREKLLKEMVAEFGEYSYIEPPLNANWGGKHVHIGEKVYANFNLTLVDDTNIYIGDYVMIGPNVVIISGNHPTSSHLRKKGL